VLKSRAVALKSHILSDFDNVVRSNPDHELVERPVVNSTHGKAVRDNGVASVSVFAYVCGVQKLRMAESAEGASEPVREKDPFAKDTLM